MLRGGLSEISQDVDVIMLSGLRGQMGSTLAVQDFKSLINGTVHELQKFVGMKLLANRDDASGSVCKRRRNNS